MEILRAENIEKKFSNHVALKNINLSIKQGTVYGILGPNGAGKTTFIRIINKILAPDKGTIYFNNKPISELDSHIIGYLPEERGLYKKMKVGEQALYLGQLKGLSAIEAKKRLQYWFQKFEIENWWNKKVEELSKGMQQKIQFIITILHNPDLIIFDEPFSGFDPINTNLLKTELLDLKKQGKTIILSTHNMSSVEELCDELTIINHSEIILQGSLSEIKENNKLNLFEITIQGNIEKITQELNVFADNIQHLQIQHYNQIQFKTKSIISRNEILLKLMKTGEILSFKEILPSMNDIFINKTKKSNNE